MQLTYRGVNYKATSTIAEAQNNEIKCKYRLSYDRNSQKIVWVRPTYFYTYRGVSYMKSPIVNTSAKMVPAKLH